MVEYTVTTCAVHSKQNQRMAACRFCGALLDEKHISGLFILEKDLPRRFSRLSLMTPDFQFTALESV